MLQSLCKLSSACSMLREPSDSRSCHGIPDRPREVRTQAYPQTSPSVTFPLTRGQEDCHWHTPVLDYGRIQENNATDRLKS